MTSHLQRPGRRLALLLCLLGGTLMPVTAAVAWPSFPDTYRTDGGSGDRTRDWLDFQRFSAEQAYQQSQHRLDQLERCLDRNRRSQERDLCVRRDLEARERQWQQDQRDWQQLIRRQGRLALLSWPLGN
jgi:hypothetical protein